MHVRITISVEGRFSKVGRDRRIGQESAFHLKFRSPGCDVIKLRLGQLLFDGSHIDGFRVFLFLEARHVTFNSGLMDSLRLIFLGLLAIKVTLLVRRERAHQTVVSRSVERLCQSEDVLIFEAEPTQSLSEFCVVHRRRHRQVAWLFLQNRFTSRGPVLNFLQEVV